MTNQTIEKALRRAVEEQKGEYIDDILRAKKTLWGFGYHQHNEFLHLIEYKILLNNLKSCNIDQLNIILAGYEKQINEHVSLLK